MPATPATAPAPAATPAAPRLCACGCGAPTVRATATFIAGHDARHAGRIGRHLATVPTARRAAVAARLTAGWTPALTAKAHGVAATALRREAERAARAAATEAARAAGRRAKAEALAAAGF